ncbi:MAG: Cof-type HAD-IIB family hydrolase [Coprobacillus sp.]|nr:Cof-type HAD-IIB family hydrolase [Coprobacillus sp.]
MKKYLFAIDMDSTLLNDKKKIPHRTISYLHKLQDEGHLIVLASGRPYRSLKHFGDEIGLKAPFICYNGAFCLHPFDNNFKQTHYIFPKEIVKEIYNACGDSVYSIMCENTDTIWASEYDEFLASFFGVEDMNLILGDINETLSHDPWTLLMRCRTNKEDTEKITNVVSKYPDYELRFWFRAAYCEVFNKNISKGECIKYIADYYHIPKENIVCIGDASNDKEMLQEAGVGVAMKNGMDSLKEIATFTTKKDCNHQGVKGAIKYIIKNQL